MMWVQMSLVVMAVFRVTKGSTAGPAIIGLWFRVLFVPHGCIYFYPKKAKEETNHHVTNSICLGLSRRVEAVGGFYSGGVSLIIPSLCSWRGTCHANTMQVLLLPFQLRIKEIGMLS